MVIRGESSRAVVRTGMSALTLLMIGGSLIVPDRARSLDTGWICTGGPSTESGAHDGACFERMADGSTQPRNDCLLARSPWDYLPRAPGSQPISYYYKPVNCCCVKLESCPARFAQGQCTRPLRSGEDVACVEFLPFQCEEPAVCVQTPALVPSRYEGKCIPAAPLCEVSNCQIKPEILGGQVTGCNAGQQCVPMCDDVNPFGECESLAYDFDAQTYLGCCSDESAPQFDESCQFGFECSPISLGDCVVQPLEPHCAAGTRLLVDSVDFDEDATCLRLPLGALFPVPVSDAFCREAERTYGRLIRSDSLLPTVGTELSPEPFGECRADIGDDAEALYLPVEADNDRDDDCDGLVDDEKCDNEDNDGDGRVDEDPGSCLMRVAVFPMGVDDLDYYKTFALRLKAVIEEDFGISQCGGNFKLKILETRAAEVRTYKVCSNNEGKECSKDDDCAGGKCSVTTCDHNMETRFKAVYTNGEELDYDVIIGLIDRDVCGTTEGVNGGKWIWLQYDPGTPLAEELGKKIVSHELAHSFNLSDQYCSQKAGASDSRCWPWCNLYNKACTVKFCQSRKRCTGTMTPCTDNAQCGGVQCVDWTCSQDSDCGAGGTCRQTLCAVDADCAPGTCKRADLFKDGQGREVACDPSAAPPDSKQTCYCIDKPNPLDPELGCDGEEGGCCRDCSGTDEKPNGYRGCCDGNAAAGYETLEEKKRTIMSSAGPDKGGFDRTEKEYLRNPPRKRFWDKFPRLEAVTVGGTGKTRVIRSSEFVSPELLQGNGRVGLWNWKQVVQPNTQPTKACAIDGEYTATQVTPSDFVIDFDVARWCDPIPTLGGWGPVYDGGNYGQTPLDCRLPFAGANLTGYFNVEVGIDGQVSFGDGGVAVGRSAPSGLGSEGAHALRVFADGTFLCEDKFTISFDPDPRDPTKDYSNVKLPFYREVGCPIPGLGPSPAPGEEPQIDAVELVLTEFDQPIASTCQVARGDGTFGPDASPPTVRCPMPGAVECSGQGGATLSYLATATDECTPELGPTCDPPSGTRFPLGSTMVTCSATDTAGNTGQCPFHVQVVDTTPPTARCKTAVVVQLDAAGQASIAENAVDDGSSDVCAGVTLDTSVTSFTCADVGPHAPVLTVTDGVGKTATCTAGITVVDSVPPTARCRDVSVTLDQNGMASVSVSAIENGSSDACGLRSTTLSKTAFDCATDIGANAVVLTVTDVNGNTATCDATVTVLQRPTTLVYQGASMGQYSDSIRLSATLTDTATGTALAGKTIRFTLGTQSVTATTNASGVATVSPALRLDQAAGTPGVATAFDGDCTYAGSSDSDPFEVKVEDASVTFDDANTVAVQVATGGGTSAPFGLTIFVKESVPDAPDDGTEAPGDIRRAVASMTLVPVGPGSAVAGVCTPQNAGALAGNSYADTLEVRCDFAGVAVNVYDVLVSIGGGYYTGAAADMVLVFDPSLGFTSGGGHFYWPGTTEKTNCGYTMKYNRKATQVQGNLLCVRHRPDGNTYRLKSNAITGLALSPMNAAFGWASFNGKGAFQDWNWDEPIGNSQFTVYVEDHGQPGTNDRIWLKVLDRNRKVVAVLSMADPATTNAVTLRGGDIFVPHTGGAN